jgi:hypothetical protein
MAKTQFDLFKAPIPERKADPARSLIDRRCLAWECAERIPYARVMCETHWKMVPEEIKLFIRGRREHERLCRAEWLDMQGDLKKAKDKIGGLRPDPNNLSFAFIFWCTEAVRAVMRETRRLDKQSANPAYLPASKPVSLGPVLWWLTGPNHVKGKSVG